jgi:hypothetical protein
MAEAPGVDPMAEALEADPMDSVPVVGREMIPMQIHRKDSNSVKVFYRYLT